MPCTQHLCSPAGVPSCAPQADAGYDAWEHHDAAAARSKGEPGITPEASPWDQARMLHAFPF